jgi:Ca2+-binding EF-hand superfamily protein
MSTNEGLSQTDIDEMIKLGTASNGQIDYAEVCRAVNVVSASINFLNAAFE